MVPVIVVTIGSGTVVIQSTVAVSDPVAPSVFSNVKINAPFSVNVCVSPPMLVTVTSVVENHVTVATTISVVLVEGL